MTEAELTTSAVLAALPSSDLARSEEFYAALIGRPADERPMPVMAQWSLDGGVLQLVEDADRAGGGLVSLIVPDMDAAVAGIRERGLPIEAADGSVVAQVATLTDPDGNQITLVEAR